MEKKDVVLFDTITLLTEIMIRYSGDSLTSVGNYVISWFMDRTIDYIAEAIFMIWDWRGETLEEVAESLPTMLEDQTYIKQIIEYVTWKAQYAAKTIVRVSKGQSVSKPESEFINGEGDDRLKGYKWSFIQKFQTRDMNGKSCRKVLGVVTAILYTISGMSLEPQDRTGRVSAEKLIDPTARMEFTSRIFVPLDDGKVMRSFPSSARHSRQRQ